MSDKMSEDEIIPKRRAEKMLENKLEITRDMPGKKCQTEGEKRCQKKLSEKLSEKMPVKDPMLAEQTLKQLGFYTKCLSGNVRKQTLIDGIDDWLLQVEQEAKNHQNPLVAVVYSGHGIKPERSEFPVLLSSDDLFEAPDWDVTVTRERLAERLNSIHPRDRGSVQVLMIFDCGRANEAIAIWRAPVGRAPSIFPSLRNDFYIVFSCDPGRRAVDFEDGGFIVPRVMRLLPYAQPLTECQQGWKAPSATMGPAQAWQLCPCHRP